MAKRASSIEYRKELRGTILNVSTKMFIANGFKAVKMDDISQALNISKRTLYEIYPNKEDLICESLRKHIESEYLEFRNSLKDTDDTMDIITSYFRLRIRSTKNMNPLLLSDLQYYPNVKQCIEAEMERHNQYNEEFFKQGQDEGFFITTVDLNLFKEINKAVLDYLSSSKIYTKFSPAEILRMMLIIFIRSLCTEKGLHRMDELLQSI